MRKKTALNLFFSFILLAATLLPLTASNTQATTGTLLNTIGSLSENIVGHGQQQGLFYIQEYYWIVYYDSGYVNIRHSSDLSTWSDPYQPFAANSNYPPSMVCDGTYFHLTWVNGKSLYYAQLTPNSDGTCTAANAQTIYYSTTVQAEHPQICVTSTNHVVVVWYRYNAGHMICENANIASNPAWSERLVPQLKSVYANTGDPLNYVVPMPDGSVNCYYATSTHLIYQWNVDYNGNVSAGIQISPNTVYVQNQEHVFSITYTGYGNSINLYYCNGTGAYDARWRQYSSGAWAASDALLKSSLATRFYVANDGSNLYAIYINSNKFYYLKYTGTWEAPVEFIDETADGGLNNIIWSTGMTAANGKIGLIYQTKPTSPYNLKFAQLILTQSQVVPWAPQFTNTPNETAEVGESYWFEPQTNETSNITVDSKPDWLTWNDGALSGTVPSASQWNVSIKAESVAGTLFAWLNWTITADYAYPIFINSPEENASEGMWYEWTPETNEVCTFEITVNPGFLFLNPFDGTLYGVPDAGGNYAVELTATNSNNKSTALNWTLNVQDVLPIPGDDETGTDTGATPINVSLLSEWQFVIVAGFLALLLIAIVARRRH